MKVYVVLETGTTTQELTNQQREFSRIDSIYSSEKKAEKACKELEASERDYFTRSYFDVEVFEVTE